LVELFTIACGSGRRYGAPMTDEKLRAWEENEDGSVTGYMCRIDWECELGQARDGNKVYPSVDGLREYHTCADTCGIVEVAVFFRKLVLAGRDDE
jgi:hypothetical protein